MIVAFDTSNYTTSVATYSNSGDVDIVQQKKLLNVKAGERGLRQSDAVFQHTVNMPQLVNAMNFDNICGVAVSTRPRNVEGSYMPCFLVGENVAIAVAKTHNVPLFKTSHQVGHILAALYSCNRLDLINEQFIAFHLSGGTTEALLVSPNKEDVISAELIATSTDLKAGQAIDRTGVLLGMSFPCGKELDALSYQSDKEFKIKPSIKNLNCSLSGVENKVKIMIDNGEKREDVAKFALSYICATVDAMVSAIKKEYGNLPLVFSGGVSSNSMLRQIINEKYGAYFARAEFSLDNAAGVAIYGALKSNLL